MEINYLQIATAAASLLAPFMPFLIEGVKEAAKGLGQSVGKASYEQARSIWAAIKSNIGDNKKIDKAAKVLMEKPQNEDYQAQLAIALAEQLKARPDLAKELFTLLGGQDSIQEVLAEKGSWVENIEQTTGGKGNRQKVHAKNDSVIKGVKQIKR
jgi:hypothetical protein